MVDRAPRAAEPSRKRCGVTAAGVLARAREQVLGNGVGLTEAQAVECLTLPDDRLDELLALAHEVRMRWCGPEVEVEG
ncbi:MAG: biotin synthase, partial [Mycobacterium sp.]|nr:biotin synthase [Mycobacterium sp.]